MPPLFLGLFLLAYAAAFFPPATHAQPVYTYDAFHSRYQVRPDGTVLVQHRVTYRFEDPSGWVGLTVPAKLGRVVDARVLDGGGEPLPEELWDLERKDNGVILWFNPSNSEGPVTVIYEYLVTGALKAEGERVFLHWTGVPVERSSPVLESSVSVELPASVSPGELQLQVKTANYRGQVQKRVVGDRQAVAELEGLESQTSYEFTASWPSRIMDLTGAGFTSQEPAAGEEEPTENLRSWEFERFDVDITVHPDATFTVRETQVVRFQGSFTYLTRDIPTRVAAFEEGRTYGKVHIRDFVVYDLEGNPLDTDSWVLEDTDGGRRVHLTFQATDQTLGWIIEYRISGAIIFAPEYDRLRWNAVSRFREANIASSRVTVRLPEGVDQEAVKTAVNVDPYAPPRKYDLGKEDGLLWWEAADVPPFTTFTLDVAFPKGLVAVPWAYRRSAGAVGIASGAAIMLGTLAVMLALWWRKAREAGGRRGHVVRYDPPEGLSPAMVGMLVRQSPDVADITATIVDLARRGHLTIFEEERRGIIRRRIFGFQRLNRESTGLLPYEERLLNDLFASGDRVTEDDLKGKFHTHLQALKEDIIKEVLARGLFSRDPAKLRRTYMHIGWGFLGLSAALYFLLPHLFDPGWLWVPALAPAPAGVIVWAVGWAMPRRSRAGSRAYGEAMGFREYLVTAEKPAPEHMTPEHFEKNLPYALVLGVVEQWARKFEGLHEQPPTWFSATDPAGGAVLLGRTLDSMNGSLTRTLSSRPSSKGSGGVFEGGHSGSDFGGGGSSAG
ncbi:MAG: DUF2207 domain-containing protein [Actinomycetota bacterium]|nr:DUF2207 domain-containing protein [Actinomycetota bacterium]